MYIDERIFREIDTVEFPDYEDSHNNIGMTRDEVDYIYEEVATKAVEEDLEDYENIEDFEDDYGDIEEYTYKYASNIINVNRFYAYGVLAQGLTYWYNGWENIEDKIRDGVLIDDYFYYQTGCGYDTISSDLLGGSANGKARSEFIDYINE